MFIKQIIIQGFKSYKDQTVMEPFSPKTNVIVGRNGSGKSNFFSAIRFVLSDAYTNMGREERQGLLHEGSGSAVMSAYVEVIFDNSDGRFIDFSEKEVVLRRTIGPKKDEYAVNRKVITNKDVVQMLESAGFSRSNPYYIVPQGRVTALTNMKEAERLNLLKEVAGTRVYENRRAESLKIMGETNNKREKIDELLKYIKERLDELEEEKEELRGFQDRDRERRCLEYAYHYREQVTIQETLEEIDSARQDGLDTTDSSRTELLDSEKAIAKLDAEMQKLQRQMELLQIDRRQLEEDRRDAAKTLAKVELRTKTLQDGLSSREQARLEREANLESVQSEIANKEKELSKVVPNFNKRKQKEDEVRRNMESAAATRSRLLSKQNHGTRFKSKQERDNHLQEEINELVSAISNQRANKMDGDEEVNHIQAVIRETQENVDDLRAQLANWQGNRAELVEQTTEAQDILDRLNDERKLLRREEEKLNSNISTARQERDQADKELRHTMDRDTARGLASIRKMKQETDMPGCHGTIADLLEVQDAYRIAVEQTAGSRLFNYVVDDDATATKLLNKLQEQRGGRVTCLPLSRLRPRNANLPQARDAVPLQSKIKYDPKFEKAFNRIFGNTVVCPNIHVGAQYSKSHGVDCITPVGDTTNKRGALSGGYVDPGRSRIHAVRAANKRRDEYEGLVAQARAIQQQIEAKDQEITAAMTECQKAIHRLKQADNGFEPATVKLRNLIAHQERERIRLDTACKRQDDAERNMNEFMERQAAHEAEMASEFKKSLSAAEERQLEEVSNRLQAMQKELNEISSSRRELQSRKQILETDLRQNLQLRLDELNSQAFEDSASGTTSQGLKEAQRELTKAQNSSKAVEADLRDTESKVDALQQKLEEVVGEKAEREQQQAEIAARIEKQQKRVEKSLAKKGILTTQLAECAKNIRDLGVLPEEAFDKYERMEAKQITSRLKKVNEALKKYKHVNKKAFEQYNSFTSQQEHLMKRRTELDDSQKSIEELMEHLDRKKDEAIERTFKQVSREFATIFEKLVPAGQGRLIIQRRTDRRQAPPDESEDEGQRSVENYQGVGISVSFNSKDHDEQQRIQQLSGGQKSLCALCLVFALQATESSPMVIFDEVDANLDAQYRTAVASLLESISNEAGTQFICTTFRPEIVHVADKSYGVTFRNKTSSINCVSTAEALEFVEGQAKPV